MRNSFGALFAAMLLATLVACGSSSPKPQSTAAAPNPTPTAAPTPSPTPTNATPTTNPSPGSGSTPAPGPTSPTAGPAPAPVPAPSPGPPNPPTPAQSATYVYARASSGVLGYRLNSDGTLAAISGSPYSIVGNMIAAGGAHLFSAAQSQVLVYGIDPVTGTLTSQSQAAVPAAGEIAAVNGFVYVTGTNSAGDFAVYAFSVATNGALAPVPGSPFFLGTNCELCASPESITADSRYLLVGTGGGHNSAGDFTLFARAANGALQKTAGSGGSSITSVALNRADTVLYALQSSNDAVMVESIDAAGQIHQVQYAYQPNSLFSIDVDPAGPYLVASTNPNGLISYQLGADGGLAKQASSITLTPSSAIGSVAFDPSGGFVILVQPGGLSVCAFNQTTGAMNLVGSAAGSFEVERPVVVTF